MVFVASSCSFHSRLGGSSIRRAPANDSSTRARQREGYEGRGLDPTVTTDGTEFARVDADDKTETYVLIACRLPHTHTWLLGR